MTLSIVVIVGPVALLYVESRAAEPVLPPRLFRNRVFVTTSAVGFVVGFAMFGSITYPVWRRRGDRPGDNARIRAD
jgi:hypothetical protein